MRRERAVLRVILDHFASFYIGQRALNFATTFVQIWHFCLASEKTCNLTRLRVFPGSCGARPRHVCDFSPPTTANKRDSANSDSGVTALLSTSSNPGVIHVWPFFFSSAIKRLSCEEGACRFCAKWLVWDRADHISNEGDRLLVGRAFGSSANSASRGVGDRPLSSGALTHGPSGQRQRQCQYRALFLPSRDAFNRGLGAAFVVVITTACAGTYTPPAQILEGD